MGSAAFNQHAATTFAFASVLILLLWRGGGGRGAVTYFLGSLAVKGFPFTYTTGSCLNSSTLLEILNVISQQCRIDIHYTATVK